MSTAPNINKNVDQDSLGKIRRTQSLHQSGAALATRALAWGTFYAFAGCGVLFFSIWKIMGVNNLKEFREKAGQLLPVIPKKPAAPGERTEFSGINDFLSYIIEKDSEKKK